MQSPFLDPATIQKQLVHETQNERVFHNIRPATKGHCIVVPKRFVTNIRDLPQDEVASLFQTVQLVSQKLKQNLDPIAFNYGFNEGTKAGQSVSHLHVHIIPRYDKDTLQEFHLFHRDPNTKRNLSDDELKPLVETTKQYFI